MGRFLNSRAAGATLGPPRAYGLPDRKPVPLETSAAAVAEEEPPPAAMASEPSRRISPVAIVGLYILCVYLISGYATDLSYRFLGTKPYVSMISGVLVFVCFLISGRAPAAFRTTVGKLWVGVAFWMGLATVFSSWRGGSFGLMQAYIPKQHMVLFFIMAFAATVPQCRTVVRACALGGFVLIVSCFFFGSPEPHSGRWVIETNVFLSNPNDLAMELLVSLGFFIFLARQPPLIGRIGGFLGIAGSAFFLLKTGSRGGALAAAVLTVMCILFSPKRTQVLMAAVPTVLVLIAVMPSGIVSRLSMLGVGGNSSAVDSIEESKAVDSANERRHLFIQSLKFMVMHPVFGLGPGRFNDAIWENGKKEGVHEASMGTHNTYTQLGAECGIPALAMFVAAIFITIRNSYRVYRATIKDPSLGVLSAIAFMCFVLGVAFSIDIFFHHVAYSGNMAILLGIWTATEAAAYSQGVLTRSGRLAAA